jgi:hypothetical protein
MLARPGRNRPPDGHFLLTTLRTKAAKTHVLRAFRHAAAAPPSSVMNSRRFN